MKRLLLLLSLLPLALGCGRSGGGGSDDGIPTLEQDFAAGQEARAWLARNDTGMFQMSKETAVGFTEKLYAAGAERVVVADIINMAEEGGSGEISATLIIKLPKDAAKRKTLFPVLNELAVQTQSDEEKDEGQDYSAFTTD